MINKLNPHSNEARKMVKAFCNYVVYLKAIHRIGAELHSDELAHQLMDQTAPMFFTDINEVLIRNFLLEAAKITDPAVSFNKYENFTVAALLETIEWPESVIDNLEIQNKIVANFRKSIKDARDKVLAHYSRDTFLTGTTLGEFTEGDDSFFISALEEMCNIMHKASFGQIFGAISVATQGDVLALKSALKKAVAFDRAFKESKDEEKKRLFKYL